ncbi:hypothetical protein V7169_18915 [Priestia megaterium]
MLWLLLLILYGIYKFYKSRRPLTKFDHFYEKAFELEEKKRYEDALDIRNQGIELHTLTDLERADLHLANGRMLLKLKQYEKATKHYDASFKLANKLAKYEEFPYSEGFDEVIEAYLYAGRKEDALIITNDMLKRQSYDQKFKKLESLKEKLLSYEDSW